MRKTLTLLSAMLLLLAGLCACETLPEEPGRLDGTWRLIAPKGMVQEGFTTWTFNSLGDQTSGTMPVLWVLLFFCLETKREHGAGDRLVAGILGFFVALHVENITIWAVCFSFYSRYGTGIKRNLLPLATSLRASSPVRF